MTNKKNNHSNKITFENKLFQLALFTGLLPCIFLFYTLYSHEMSLYLKIMLMFFILVTVLYCAFAIRQKVTFQLRTSSNLMEAMISNDHSLRARHQGGGGALTEFNQMFNELSATLAEQKLLSKEKQVLFHKVIAQIDVAIVAFNKTSGITLMNPTAEKLFSCRFVEIEGSPLKALGLEDVQLDEYSKVVEFEIKAYKKKVYLHTDSYFENGIKQTLIFITDIQKLLRDEERQTWQKLLRVLSHEINNSLAPIASISETLTKLLSNHSAEQPYEQELTVDLNEGLAVIGERSNSLHNFIQRYQELTRLPTPNKALVDLEHLIKSVTTLFDQAKFEVCERSLTLYADEDQLQQVLVNLIKNAYQSMESNAGEKITLTWHKTDNHIEIHIIDEGCGLNNLDNLFVPFYSTKENGSGIGLVLSRQIIINHGGDLTINNRADHNGSQAIIYLPSNSST